MGKIIVCVGCGEKKEHYARGTCKPCWACQWKAKNPEKVKAARQRHYKKCREKILAKNRQWVKGNPGKVKTIKRRWAEKNLEYQREWYLKNREEHLKRARQWREGNPKRYAVNQKRWRKENPERKKGIEARRQARKKGLPSTLTEEERSNLFIIGQGTYPNEKLHLDHFVPISKGGGTTRANVHYIPAILNSSKKDKLPQEIYNQLELWE